MKTALPFSCPQTLDCISTSNYRTYLLPFTTEKYLKKNLRNIQLAVTAAALSSMRRSGCSPVSL